MTRNLTDVNYEKGEILELKRLFMAAPFQVDFGTVLEIRKPEFVHFYEKEPKHYTCNCLNTFVILEFVQLKKPIQYPSNIDGASEKIIKTMNI